jgi:hypothetical protein
MYSNLADLSNRVDQTLYSDNVKQRKSMFDDPKGPITHFSWGKFVIGDEEHSESGSGQIGAGKDIRLIGKEATEWKERKGHRLKKSMITGVYDRGIEILIIGTGVFGTVECPKKVKKALRAHGISELILQKTPDACAAYNELFHQGKRVALLAHGTC